MKNTKGITCNPIIQLSGLHEFNEVVFEDAFMPDDASARRGRRRLEAGDERARL